MEKFAAPLLKELLQYGAICMRTSPISPQSGPRKCTGDAQESLVTGMMGMEYADIAGPVSSPQA
jgi:hypothetical protein